MRGQLLVWARARVSSRTLLMAMLASSIQQCNNSNNNAMERAHEFKDQGNDCFRKVWQGVEYYCLPLFSFALIGSTWWLRNIPARDFAFLHLLFLDDSTDVSTNGFIVVQTHRETFKMQFNATLRHWIASTTSHIFSTKVMIPWCCRQPYSLIVTCAILRLQ